MVSPEEQERKGSHIDNVAFFRAVTDCKQLSFCLWSLPNPAAAIPSAASKVHVTPEGWPANELLMNTDSNTKGGWGGGGNNGSVKENELLHVLQETNHQTHGLLRTEGAKLELSSVSRNHCGTLTVKIFVWPAFNLLCVQEFFRPSVGAFL